MAQSTTSTKTSKNIGKLLASRMLNLLVEELAKPEIQTVIRRHVIIPVINLIYSELYPYIVGLIATIGLILVLSIFTCMGFLMYYLKKT